MARRIILGPRGADTGLWISKRGIDAGSTSDDDFLVSPSRFLTQPLLSGRITAPSNGTINPRRSDSYVSLTITHNLGYIPVVEILGVDVDKGTQYTATVSTTDVKIKGVSDNVFFYANNSTKYYLAVDVYYAIFRSMVTPS